MARKLFVFLCVVILGTGLIKAQSGVCGESVFWELAEDTLIVSGVGEMTDFKTIYAVPWKECRSVIRMVVVKDSVTHIGQSAFSGCVNLIDVLISNTVVEIGAMAFEDCSSLKHIEFGSEVQDIGNYAFGDCVELTELLFPESLVSIGYGAFDGCSALNEIIIPSKVANIGDYAFYKCKALDTILVVSDNLHFCSIDGVLFSKDTTELIQYPIANARVEYIVPPAVTTICKSSFRHCSSLAFLTIGYNVSRIDYGAFDGCFGLEVITCLNPHPANLEEKVFVGDCPIFVPCGSLESYHSSWKWRDYVTRVQYVPLPYKIEGTVTNALFGSVCVPESTCDTFTTAIPYYGYHFTQWTDGNTDNPRLVELTQDTIMTAQFARNTYTLSLSASDSTWGQTTCDTTALYLDTLEIAATANEGYYFSQWTDGNTDNPRSFVLTKDTSFTAQFERLAYEVSVFCDTTQGSVCGGGTYLYGDSVIVMALAWDNYQFVQWSNGVTNNPYSFILYSNVELIAEFSLNSPQSTEELSSPIPNDAQGKIILDTHQIVIIRNGKRYTIHGQEL